MFNNLNNINKNARKYSAPNNYPNFKTITFNNPSSNTKGNETFQLGINPENFQNSFGRNAFFQSFWKAYSKSYDYDYYPTSSDVNKTASDFYREISSIFDENSKNRELDIGLNLGIINRQMDTENFNDFNLKKNDIFHPHILNQNTQYNMQKVGGIFKPRQPIKKNIKNTNNNKNKFENTEKKFTENKVQAVFQSYKLFEPDSNQPEINDY